MIYAADTTHSNREGELFQPLEAALNALDITFDAASAPDDPGATVVTVLMRAQRTGGSSFAPVWCSAVLAALHSVPETGLDLRHLLLS